MMRYTRVWGFCCTVKGKAAWAVLIPMLRITSSAVGKEVEVKAATTASTALIRQPHTETQNCG